MDAEGLPRLRNDSTHDRAESALDVGSVAALLDSAAAERSWTQLARSTPRDLGYPSLVVHTYDGTVAGAALDAVAYILTFDDTDGRTRAELLPRSELDDSSWPVKAELASPGELGHWRELLEAVTEPALRARLEHLLFQAGDGNGREHAVRAGAAYLAAMEEGWGPETTVHFGHASLRLSLAVGDSAGADRAAHALRSDVERAVEAGAGGRAAHGVIVLAGVPRLPFSFDDLANAALARMSHLAASGVLDAWIGRAGAAERPALWRRRVQLEVDAAEAVGGLVGLSRLQTALRLAERSSDNGLRKEVAARLQAASQQDFDMSVIQTLSRRYAEEVQVHAEAMLGAGGFTSELVRWAGTGPLTGNASDNRELTRGILAVSLLWQMLPVEVLGGDNLPVWNVVTPEERLDYETLGHELRLLEGGQSVLVRALRLLTERHGWPARADLTGFLLSWPGLDPLTAYVAAGGLLRFWAGDFDGCFYTTLPQIERTARHLVVAADEGVYRVQRDSKPGQYPGLGFLLGLVDDKYGLGEDWRRYYAVCLDHPAGLNLRNLAHHGFQGPVDPGMAAITLHLLLHLGTLVQP